MLENERAEVTGLENERAVEERRVDFEEDVARIARINTQFATARDLLDQEMSCSLLLHLDCPYDPASEGDVRLFMQVAGVAPEARDITFSTAQALLQEWVVARRIQQERGVLCPAEALSTAQALLQQERVEYSADEHPAEGKQ